MRHIFFLVSILVLTGLCNSAQAFTIDWADVVSNSNVPSAVSTLYKPDGIHASFYDTSKLPLSATYSGFGVGDTINYSMSAFAALLGVSEAVISSAEFFTTEFNGNSDGTYESGLWKFSDGTHDLIVDFESANPTASGYIAAYGNINNYAYASFFGFTNPYPQYGNGNNWAFLLFDIDGDSNINIMSDNFNVTLTAANTGSGPADPDPDVMGRIRPVPEPTTLSFLGLGLLGLVFKNRNRCFFS